MRDLIIITITTVFFYIISIQYKISNTALDYLVNLTPVIIPTFFLWYRTPKNYLKLMSLWPRNIYYDLTLKFEGCPLEKDDYKQIQSILLKLYPDKTGRILKEDYGQFIFISTIEVVSTVIDLNYSIEKEELMLVIKDRVKYRIFFKFVNKVYNSLIKYFTSPEKCYEKNQGQLRIDFYEEEVKENCKNPFYKNLFRGFNNKIVSFKYKTKNNSIIEISNHQISFLSDDLEKMNKDIKDELKLIHFMN